MFHINLNSIKATSCFRKLYCKWHIWFSFLNATPSRNCMHHILNWNIDSDGVTNITNTKALVSSIQRWMNLLYTKKQWVCFFTGKT